MMNQVNNVAAQGRYGDSMLMHVNPNEVKGLAQLGALSLNPSTGLPEAFKLKDLLPIVASIVGGAFGGPMGAALGSGLTTAAVEGDLKKGLFAGLSSYALGSLLRGATAAGKAGQAGMQEISGDAVGALADASPAVDASSLVDVTSATDIAPVVSDIAPVVPDLGGPMSGSFPDVSNASTTFLGAPPAETGVNFMPGAKDFYNTDALINTDITPFGAGIDSIAGTGTTAAAGAGIPGANVVSGINAGAAESAVADTVAGLTEEESRKVVANAVQQSMQEQAERQALNLPLTSDAVTSTDPNIFSDLSSVYESPGTINPLTGELENVGGFDFGTTMSNVSTAAMNPSFYVPGAVGFGGLGVMKSQEEYEAMLKQLELDEENKRRQMYLDYPEAIPGTYITPLPSASGGQLKYQEGGITYDPIDPDLSGGFGYYGQAISNLNLNDPSNFYGAGMQYVPKREANPIPMGYMPGFMPEFDYFSNTNPAASDLQSGVSAGISDLGAADVPSAPVFSPTQSPSYQQFYGSAAQGVPQILDPTQKMNPFQVGPFVPPPPPPAPPIIPPDDGTPTPTPAPTPAPTPPPPPDDDERYGDYRLGPISPVDKDPRGFGEPSPGPSGLFSKLGSIAKGPGSEPSSGLPGMISELAAAKEPFAPSGIEGPESMPIAPPMSRQEPEPVQLPDPIAMPILEPEAMPMPIAQPMPIAAPVPPMPVQKPMPMPVAAPVPSGIEDNIMSNQIAIAGMEDSEFPVFKPESLEEQIARNKMIVDMLEKDERRMSPRRMKKGGDTFQEGGATFTDQQILEDPITKSLIAFLLGEISDDSALNMFIDKYGTETFQRLRESVLKTVVPNAQVEGQIQGTNQGGMADDIDGMIGNKQPVAVSQDEFIVPADVVSSLGDGSSDAGADKLYRMMDRVRQAKNGGTTQPPEIKDSEVLPV